MQLNSIRGLAYRWHVDWAGPGKRLRVHLFRGLRILQVGRGGTDYGEDGEMALALLATRVVDEAERGAIERDDSQAAWRRIKKPSMQVYLRPL